MKYDSYLLDDFFDELNKLNFKYCVMNNYHEMPEVIPTDIDFAVEYKLFNKLDNIIYNFATKHNIEITQKIWHGYNKCAYILSPLEFPENLFRLQLDFFVDFSGRGYTNLIPIENMLEGRRNYKNFFIPSKKIELPFLFFRRIFKGDLNNSHLNELNMLVNDLDSIGHNPFKKIFNMETKKLIYKIIQNRNIDLFKKNLSLLRKEMKDYSNKNTSFIYRAKYITTQSIRAIVRSKTPIGFATLIFNFDENRDRKPLNTYVEKLSGSYHGYKEIHINKKFNFIQKIRFLIKIWILKIKKNHIIVINKNNDMRLDYFIDFNKFNEKDLNLHVSNSLKNQAKKIKSILNDYFSPTRGFR